MKYLTVFKKIFFVFFVLNCFLIFSQEDINSINQLIQKDFYANPLQAKKNCFKLLKLAKVKKDDKTQAYAFFYLAEINGTISQKDSGLFYYDKAFQKAKEINDINSLLIFKTNKANYLLNEYDIEAAHLLYKETQEIADKANNKYISDYIDLKKGVIYLETNKFEEAINIFKKGLANESFDKSIILENYLNLSKAYLKNNDYKNSLLYSQKGYKLSVNFNSQFEIHFLNMQGIAYFHSKNYNVAEKKLKLALEKSIKSNYYEMSRLININISKVYTLQGNNKKAIAKLNTILRNEENISIVSENKYEIYHLLAENYKLTDEISEANNYYELFIEESKKINSKKLKNIELLLKSDIERLSDQKNDLTNQKWYLWITIIALIILLCLFIIRKRVLDKRNTEKFNELIKNIEQNLVQNNLKNINSSKNDVNIREVKYSKTTEDDNSTFTEQSSNINENQVFTIKDYTITEILDGLIKLEKKQYYLKQECTLHNVAKKLKTNTAYLSKIVNSELGKNFSAYINDLRINYVLIELKNNKRLRSYSIAAISEEVGYKSPDSFNKYFKEATGLTPSIFIKKINELEKD